VAGPRNSNQVQAKGVSSRLRLEWSATFASIRAAEAQEYYLVVALIRAARPQSLALNLGTIRISSSW
jgi:hypothetical protein